MDAHLQVLLSRYSLRQLVTDPTHVEGNTLDLLIVPEQFDDLVNDVSTHSLCFTDHSLVRCRLGIPRRRPPIVQYSYRDIKHMDMEAFRWDILQSRLYDPSTAKCSADEYADLFANEVTRVLDRRAPLKSKIKRQGTHDGYRLSDEARAAKMTCRRLERRFRRTLSDDDKKAFAAARLIAREKISRSRADELKEKVAASVGDSARMWRTTRQLLHSTPPNDLDDDECVKMSKAFSCFFIDKIDSIRGAIKTALNVSVGEPAQLVDRAHTGPVLTQFSEVTVDEVTKLINSMSCKSSPLDVLPTSLLKSCCDVFAPVVVRLANLSFTSGTFPSTFKTAQVLPLLKKPGLDRTSPANYRPISNLNTVSKIIERLALARLKPHVYASNNFNPLQSAYRSGHSTETALLHVLDKLYAAIDKQKLTVLIGLDLSAAFDTVDHRILLQRLNLEFGIENTVLSWIKSYLTDRKQYVKLGRHRSETTMCTSGVPQGSVLGPILFALYVSPVGNVIAAHDVQYHQYADDTQLLYALKATNIDSDLKTLQTCSRAVKRWFLENGLQLNPEKSEVILVGTAQQLHTAKHVTNIEVAGAIIPVRTQLKSLGVIIDNRLTLVHMSMPLQELAIITFGCCNTYAIY